VLLFRTWHATALRAGSTPTRPSPTRSIQGCYLALPDGRNERRGLDRGQSRPRARLFIVSSEKNDRH
jgi:hypothetical protein